MSTSKPESANAGVNGSFVIAGLMGISAGYVWPHAAADWTQHAIAWMLAGTSAASAMQGVRLLAKDIRIRKRIIDSEKPGTEHGSAREATLAELEARGMLDPSSGSFIGMANGRAIFMPPDAPFGLIEAPPGSGKDIGYVVGDISHHAMMRHAVFAPDVKLELGPMLADGLRKAGIEVWCVNPTGQFEDQCGNVELGLYQALIDAVHGDNNQRKDAIGIAKSLSTLHLPDDSVDKSKLYFVGGTRRCLMVPPLLYALIDPTRCHPTSSFEVLSDPDRFQRLLETIMRELEPLGPDDKIVEYLKSEAANLLHRAKTNPENFGSFLEWATQVLATYNQAGHLAEYGKNSTQKIDALTERPITLFVMSPQSHAKDFEAYTSILNANLFTAIKRNPRKMRVHFVLNEFLNYHVANIASELELMRGLGATMNFYIQSFAGLVRRYGRETAAAIGDYCDVKIYAGLNSYDRAKHLSDLLSDTTIASKDYSYKSKPDEVNVSSKRHARRLMTTDEILAMPRDEAWVCVKGLRPFRVKITHYGHVSPWRDALVGTNPLEGAPLKGKKLVEIDYGQESLQ